jgi:hypothetical protein
MRSDSKLAASSFMSRPRKSESETLSKCTSPISFDSLSSLWLKSLRSGSWARIGSAEKALYRCALWIAKERGCIINKGLVAQVLEISGHLLGRIRSRITAAGKERARLMLKSYSSRGGVFGWAPQVNEWLHDATYIFYLGVNSQP